jgi:hypothetical protein
LVGLGLGATLLILLVAADRSVRSEADLPAMSRLVGAVPRLRLEHIPKRADPGATRRAIAFVVGTALPAPRGAK